MVNLKFGDVVKDPASGYRGTIIARCEYDNGCIQFQVKSDKLQDGVPIEIWFDEQHLAIVKKTKKAETTKKDGGQRNSPSGRSHPTR